MKVEVKWFNDNFNVALSSAEGKEPFLEIKGARIVDGKNGPFVSWPSKKLDSGKYWNHVYGSEQFNAVVLSKAEESRPTRQERRQREDGPIPF